MGRLQCRRHAPTGLHGRPCAWNDVRVTPWPAPVADGPVPEIDGSILTIHMAALAHVLAARVGDTPPSDPGELSAYLLSRERSHWQSMYDNDRRVESPPQVMGRAVHVAALTRSLDYDAAVTALKSAGVADTAVSAGRVLDDHAMCYPPHDPVTALEPLYPDRLAEDFVALQTPGHRIGGFAADPWAAGAPRSLLGDGGTSAATVLTLLIEGARRLVRRNGQGGDGPRTGEARERRAARTTAAQSSPGWVVIVRHGVCLS